MQRKIPFLFLLIGLILGTGYAFILPPLQAPDEVAHFLRAYDLSQGRCVVQPGDPIPRQIRQLQSLYPGSLERVRHISRAELIALASTPLAPSPQTVVGYNNGCLYACVPYIPAAIAIAPARIARVPALDLIYLGRIANLLVYLALVYIALRIIPDFGALLFALALMPMALHQGTSLSPDSLSIAVSFLLCADILRLAFAPGVMVSPRDQAALAGLVAVASLSKFNIWLILLVMIIPVTRFRSAREKWLFTGGQIALACLVAALWQYANRRNIGLFQSIYSSLGIRVNDNLKFVYDEPVLFIAALVRTIRIAGSVYINEFVGTLAWLSVRLPQWLIYSYTILLAALAFLGSNYVALTKKTRLLMAIAVAGSFVSTFVLLWSFNAAQSNIDEVSQSRGVLPGVQGRYFIPFALPAFLLLANRRFRVDARVAAVVTIVLTLIANAVALQRLVETFYVPASQLPGGVASAAKTLNYTPPVHDHYEGNLVQRTGGLLQDGKVYVVLEGRKHWVQDVQWTLQRGYRWPDDIVDVPAAQLDAIPTADPVR